MKIKETRTKIIATYGPACEDKDILLNMVKAGADVIRFNFSHGDWDFHKRGMEQVHAINEEYGLNITILADLQGPKIRVGQVEGEAIQLVKGNSLEITVKESVSTDDKVFVNYDRLAKDVKKGEKILIDDGKIELLVTDSNNTDTVTAEVIHGGTLTSKKGVNLPHTKTSIPALTQKDKADLDFAVEHGANWIALSFVRDPEDIVSVKKLIGIGDDKLYLKVIAKIEKPEALNEMDEIIAVSDGIMIARGDLGVEVPQEQMPLIQKDIIKKCIKAAKPVVVATQMMETMIHSQQATRAEITDVANAVIDGTDAVMLSGETSVGKYPVRVIETMSKILTNVEKADLIYNKDLSANPQSPTFTSDAICYNSCNLSKEINAKALIGMTRSGYTAFMTSSYRPKAGIFIFTDNRKLLNTLNICWGVKAFYYDKFVSTDDTIADVIEILKVHNEVFIGDVVVNTASMPMNQQARTNMIKLTVVN
ncbi:MAG: pyruvate kinase [Chitinophagales bacterium]|nr:pyruvate kinase [Chitinophagales bacterium]